MEIKFAKSSKDYQYVLSFDLAKRRTGYSLLSIENRVVLETGLIDTDLPDSMVWIGYYDEIADVINEIKEKYGEKSFFVVKERLPNQNGPHSNIAALQELAKAHAIFDLVIAQKRVDCYDFTGVHSITVKGHYRHLTGIKTPTKQDIFNAVLEMDPNCAVNDGEYDITDSVAVAVALLDKKWNSDIDTKVRELRKEMRKVTSLRALDAKRTQIKKLESLRR